MHRASWATAAKAALAGGALVFGASGLLGACGATAQPRTTVSREPRVERAAASASAPPPSSARGATSDRPSEVVATTDRPLPSASTGIPAMRDPVARVFSTPGKVFLAPPGAPAPVPNELAGGTVLSADVCPVGIPGLVVRAVQTARGAALEMRADPDHVRALQERMARFARLHRQAREAHAGRRREPPAIFGDEDAMIHQATVTAVPTRDGVRVVARADRLGDVAALRQEIRDDAEAISRGSCPLALEIVT